MKTMITVFLVTVVCHAMAPRLSNLDFSLDEIPSDGGVVYGWTLLPWYDWLGQRKSSGPLIVPTNFNKNDIEVFEARAPAVVKTPITFFTQQYFLNVNTLKLLDPSSQYTKLAGPAFTVETVIPFPQTWADAIAIAKRAKALDDKTTGYIKIQSVIDFKTRPALEANPGLLERLNLLNSSGRKIDAVQLQGSIKVNQIADFISIVTMFHRLDDSRTLVITYSAIALKKHLLNKAGFLSGIKFSGRNVLLGESAVNTDSGIGAGLPKYFAEFFNNMIQGFEKPL